MLDKKTGVTRTVLGLLAVIALSAGLFVSQHLHKKKTIDARQLTGTLLDKPRMVQPFSLVGIDHKPFNNASLRGQWTMVFFGFTQCGYLCPTTLAELGKMYRLLGDKGVKNRPQVIMISVDPARDNEVHLAHYVRAFDPHFYGARGSLASIKAMTQALGIAYLKVARNGSHDASDYDIEHTGTLLLFNPKGELIAFFTTPHHAEQLAHDYLLLTA